MKKLKNQAAKLLKYKTFLLRFGSLALLLIVAFAFLALPPTQAQSVTWEWYQSDTHTHSAVSSEALLDLGIMSQATNFGYDVLFLSDHNDASAFHVNNLSANHMAFEDDYIRWDSGTYGNPVNPINELVTNPVHTENKSLHLKNKATSQYSESYIWGKRGPNRLGGDIILKVSIYPKRIDPNSAVYVSLSFGGDPMVEQNPFGYTTEAGVISPGKSTVLVWQLGNARSASSDPNERVLTYPLSYTLNTWNHYTINVSEAIADIPAADLPLAYNGVTHLKMAAGAKNNGTAEAYFDTYSIDASAPQEPADEYVNRTAFVDDFNTASFKFFPSYEMGQQRHTNRFNYGITEPADHRSYLFGTDGIPETHELGYPAQLNHPGTTILVQEVLDNLAYEADLLEVREDEWLDVWDQLLTGGTLILGTWTSDAHQGLSEGKAATQIYATSLDFDPLMRSLYEGRTYMARNHFTGRTILNLDSSSEPYPARYPIYHSDAQSSADVHLLVTEDLGSNYTVTWIRNGEILDVVTPPGDSHEETRSILLGAQPWTYVRAEVRRSTGSLRAATQPLFFIAVPGLPVDKQFHIEGITTDKGRGYNKLKSKGITAYSWDNTSEILHLQLENPPLALVDLRLTSHEAPHKIKLDGTALSEAISLNEFQASSSSIWYYDSAEELVYLKALHASELADLLLEFAATGDTIAPSIPTNLTANPIHLGEVDLTWTESTDNLFVAGYKIYREGTLIGTSQIASYSDTTVMPETSYSYTVSAFDVAGNESAQSSPVSVTTPATGSFTYIAEADAYVDQENPTQNKGTATTLYVRNTLARNSYLRFNVQNLVGIVSHASLWLYANGSSSIGIDVHGVSDNSWQESTITYQNAPPMGGVVDSSDAINANSWVELDVTSLIQGNGLVSFALTRNSSNLGFVSREGGVHAPKLIIETNVYGTATPTPMPTATPTASPTATPIVGGGSITLLSHADTYVKADLPNNNYGSSTSIRLDASPVQNGYLRFDLSPYAGAITRATLRLFANSSSTIGYEVRGVSDNNWQESSMSYNNAPPFGSMAGSSGSFSGGTWSEIDVTSLVTTGQEVSFGLTTSSNTAINFSSREGSNPPQLIIEGNSLRQMTTIQATPIFGPLMLDNWLYLPIIEH